MTETEITTDLREESDEMLLCAYGDAVSIWSAVMNRHAVNDEDHLRVMRSTRAELERRLARPDALRARVMAAIADLPDYWDRENYQTLVHVTRDDLTAAVVAALEVSDD
jgi:hypothetical protein